MLRRLPRSIAPSKSPWARPSPGPEAGYQPYLDFVSTSRLRAIVWSLESDSRILTICGICERQQANSHSLVFGKC